MSWWRSLLSLVGAAAEADAEDAGRAERRNASARRAGEMAAEAERRAEEARSRARRCAVCLGTGCRLDRECDVCGGSGRWAG